MDVGNEAASDGADELPPGPPELEEAPASASEADSADYNEALENYGNVDAPDEASAASMADSGPDSGPDDATEAPEGPEGRSGDTAPEAAVPTATPPPDAHDSASGTAPGPEGAAAAICPADEKKRKKPTTEGSNFQTKINVGFNHQVPFTPAFFLDSSYGPAGARHEWARLMYSPYQMERIRRRKLREGQSDKIIKNEFELAEFIQLCAKNWKNSPGWHPFSPEFAYKILHFADYDPHKALKYMNDPNFNFACVCDPPVRRYDNKWKPKDRRGQVPTNPYPPPVTLRGYLLRRHNK